MLPAEVDIDKLPPIRLPACCYTLAFQHHYVDFVSDGV